MYVATINQIAYGTRVPEVPRHFEMTERVFETRGLDPSDFEFFRAELLHPPIHSIFFLAFQAFDAR